MKKAMIGMVMMTMALVGCGKQNVSYMDACVVEAEELNDGYDLVTVEVLETGELHEFVEGHDDYHAPYTKIVIVDGEMDRLS